MTSLLSRLTAPPPDEIAGLLNDIDDTIAHERSLSVPAEVAVHVLGRCAAALRALAQENERLRKLVECQDCMEYAQSVVANDRKRIRELEAERDAEKDRRLRAETHLADAVKAHEGLLQTEHDAIRRKTIEDAKRAIVGARFGAPSNWGGDRPRGWHLDRPCTPWEAAMHDNGCNDAFMAVSALAHSGSEGKEES